MRVGVLAAAVLTLATAACGTTEGAKPAASDKEITVYSGREEKLVKPLFEQFTKATGIKVNARYGTTAAMATQLLEEGAASKADVFLAQDAGALGAVAKKGLFAPLPGEVTGKVPADYRGKDGNWVAVTGRARVVIYNPDKVKEADLPKTAYEVTDPKWKGQVGIAPTNASFQTFVTAIRVKDGDAKAKSFLDGLKANGAQKRDSNGLIRDDVNKGTLSLGLINHYYWFEKAKEVGKDKMKAKLHFLRNGDPGALVNVSGLGVLKNAKDDVDTRGFVNYLLGTDGQKYFTEKTFEYPAVGDVPPAPELPKLADLGPPKISLDDLDSLEASISMIKAAGLV